MTSTPYDSHLEQIGLSADSLSALSFSPAGPFTNAILRTQDITALIRDTEPHERSLFTVGNDAQSTQAPSKKPNNVRRGTIFAQLGQVTEPSPAPARTRQTLGPRGVGGAVGALLGDDISYELAKASRQIVPESEGRKEEVNVEKLLNGAAKLCTIYPMPDVSARIETLRGTHRQLKGSVAHYQGIVDAHSERLAQLNETRSAGDQGLELDGDEDETGFRQPAKISLADLRREEMLLHELEEKKRQLEARSSRAGTGVDSLTR